MNIIVFGGGTVGKFGNDFCLKAREQGHNVEIFSHVNNNAGHKQHIINYSNIAKTNYVIQKVLSNLNEIDIVLFNQRGSHYPRGKELTEIPDMEQYQISFNSHMVVPHLFLALAKDKIKDDGKVINMATNLSWVYDSPATATLVGYSSGKSFLTHYIHALARNRTNKVTYFSISPSMDYSSDEGKQNYPSWFQGLYDFILNCTDEYNGEIVSAYKANEFRKQKISQNWKQ